MARTDVPLIESVRAVGTLIGAAGTEVAGDATNGHSITNDGSVYVIARNSGGTTRNIGFLLTQTTVDGVAVTAGSIGPGTPPVVASSVATATSRSFGPFPIAQFGQTADGKLYVNVDHAELKLQAFHLGR
jgi:hypothetical protein